MGSGLRVGYNFVQEKRFGIRGLRREIKDVLVDALKEAGVGERIVGVDEAMENRSALGNLVLSYSDPEMQVVVKLTQGKFGIDLLEGRTKRGYTTTANGLIAKIATLIS